MKKMFGRLMSGDSMFQNRFTAEGSDGTVAFASSFPGAIKALDISNGHSMIVQKSAFLASEEGVELSMYFQKKLGKGIFGGEGFIMQKLSGNGTAFVEIDGHAVEYDLNAGQEILISTGYLAAMEESCTMDIVAVKGVKNMPNIKSAKKRVKVNAKKAAANKAANSALKTAIKKANVAIETNAADKDVLVKDAVKKIDKAAANNLIHKNCAARKKSNLAKKVNA